MTDMDDKSFEFYIRNIQKTCKSKGEWGRKPSEGSVCSIESHLLSGSCSSLSKLLTSPSLTFTVGDGECLEDRIVENCVSTMTIGEKSEFSLNVTSLKVSFSVSLNVCFFKPYIFQMSDSEKIALASKYKERGVELFKLTQTASAFYKFSQALKIIISLNLWYLSEDNNEDLAENQNYDEVVGLRVNLYNNLALCHFQGTRYAETILVCSKSLKMQSSVKALYRRALAFIELLEYEKAEADLLELLKIEPNNKAALKKLTLTRELDKDSREKYTATVRNMFKT